MRCFPTAINDCSVHIRLFPPPRPLRDHHLHLALDANRKGCQNGSAIRPCDSNNTRPPHLNREVLPSTTTTIHTKCTLDAAGPNQHVARRDQRAPEENRAGPDIAIELPITIVQQPETGITISQSRLQEPTETDFSVDSQWQAGLSLSAQGGYQENLEWAGEVARWHVRR